MLDLSPDGGDLSRLRLEDENVLLESGDDEILVF
jgi:hypothetical protein